MRWEQTDIVCSHCEKRFSAKMITVVDRRNQSDRYAAPEELFSARCPRCGKETQVNHFAVWYEDVSQTAVCNLTCKEEETALRQILSTLTALHPSRNNSRRLVFSPARFCEKITILSNGWDDRMIEIVKRYVAGSFLTQYPDKTLRDVLFFQNQDQTGFWIVCEEGNFAVPVTETQLKNAAAEYSFSNPAPEIVDGVWAQNQQKEDRSC